MLKNSFKKIIEKGISAEILKIIAATAMLIDHIGYYLYKYLPSGVYSTFRGIGRIAMPIFVYLLVQGFFYTKNFKKYIGRITITAVITQTIFITLGILNKSVDIFTGYITNVYNIGNILFSFSICLMLMYIIHHNIVVKKWNKNQNLFLKIFIVLAIIVIYVFIPIDYDLTVPMLAIIFYFVERLKITVMLNRQSGVYSIKSMFSKSISEQNIKYIYRAMLTLTIVIVALYRQMNLCVLFSIIPICLYNGYRGRILKAEGKKNKLISRYGWYIFFPLHHLILYSLAMILSHII